MTKIHPPRIAWLDTLKAIALFFVVLGHTDGIGDGARTYIYSFHIPLFFFMAGFLVREEALRGTFAPFARKYLRSLIIPYWGFGLATYLIWLLAGRHYGRDLLLAVAPVKPLLGMLYGIGVDHWLRHNVALWFLPALFCLHLISFFVQRWGQGLTLVFTVIVVSLAGSVLGPLLPVRLPWGIEPACAGVLFYGAGRLARGLPSDLLRRKGRWRWLIPAICLIIQGAGIRANGRVDMNELLFGNLAAFYLTALCGIGFWVWVSMALPASTLATTVAREAMVIFPLHTLIFSMITLVAVKALHLPAAFRQGSLLAAGVYTVLTFLILIPMAPLIRKGLPGLRA